MMLFSIVTVCKDNVDGLIKTCKSLEVQSCRDFEWIVIDGNSSDGTVEWLSHRNEDYIKWVSEPDKGIFDAMNKGIKKSTGDYVIFMNSSDQFAAKSVLNDISAQVKNSVSPVGFLYGDSIDESLDGKRYYKKSRSHKDIWKGLFTQHQSMIFKRQHLDKIKYPLKYKYNADYYFIIQYLKLVDELKEKIIKLNFPICIFLLGGMNEKTRLKAIIGGYNIRKEILEINSGLALLLLILHVVHYCLKKTVPALMRKLRYESVLK